MQRCDAKVLLAQLLHLKRCNDIILREYQNCRLIGIHKTGCSEETRLVLLTPSLSELETDFTMIIINDPHSWEVNQQVMSDDIIPTLICTHSLLGDICKAH